MKNRKNVSIPKSYFDPWIPSIVAGNSLHSPARRAHSRLSVAFNLGPHYNLYERLGVGDGGRGGGGASPMVGASPIHQTQTFPKYSQPNLELRMRRLGGSKWKIVETLLGFLHS